MIYGVEPGLYPLSWTYITHVVDADIRPINDQEPSAEHTDQYEPIYDTYLLEKVDSNTTSDSTNMCHMGGEIDQDVEQDQVKSSLLKAEFLKMNDMVEKEVYNKLLNRFIQLEKHCISLKISMQQKKESFQSNKPVNSRAKVQSPKFRNNIKPAKRIPNVNKSERWISKGYRFSPNESFVVHEKPNTLRSCLRWKLTGKIFKTASLSSCLALHRQMAYADNTSGPAPQRKESSGLIPQPPSLTPNLPPIKSDWDTVFYPLFDVYFNPPQHAISLVLASVVAPRAVDPAGSPSSTIINQDVPFASTSLTIQEIQA
nr:hypothetical protein [Tanacetum cinerariifolium]